MSHQPEVAVVIPCYGQAHYLVDAVESVVAQTWPEIDCVIVDDGSPDDTADVAQRLIAAFPERRIRLLRQENQGLSAARNSGIAATRADYVLPLDADDVLDPEAVERYVTTLSADPQLDVVYACGREFGDSHRRLQTYAIDAETIWKHNCPMYASMFRRSAWERAGGYATNMVYGYEDWNLWITILEQGGRFAQLSDELLFYRRHGRTMVEEADEKRIWLRARMVLNHPGLRPSDQDVAREIFELGEDEPSPAQRMRIVRWLLGFGVPGEAVSHCEALLDHPDLPADAAARAVLWFTLGLGLSERSQIERATQAFEEAVRLQPTNAEYKRHLATAWLGMGDQHNALNHLEDALEIEPNSSDGLALAGRIGLAWA